MKYSDNIFFWSLHSVYLLNLRIFFANKTLEILFQEKNHFRDGMTRLVINTRLFTTLKSVAMLKIIEVFLFMHSTLCGWMHFESFITHSLEDGFVCVQFLKWWQIQNIAKCKYLFPSTLP